MLDAVCVRDGVRMCEVSIPPSLPSQVSSQCLISSKRENRQFYSNHTDLREGKKEGSRGEKMKMFLKMENIQLG
jgi:hypothetical protein